MNRKLQWYDVDSHAWGIAVQCTKYIALAACEFSSFAHYLTSPPRPVQTGKLIRQGLFEIEWVGANAEYVQLP